MIITIFKKKTGEIVKVCSVPQGHIDMQLNDDESFMAGEWSDDKYYIENDAPVAMPTKPSRYHIFNYETKNWYDKRSLEDRLNVIRAQRNSLLAKTDWTQLQDVSLTTEQKREWATYRQALRDFPDTCNIENPVWPTPPK